VYTAMQVMQSLQTQIMMAPVQHLRQFQNNTV
jgi:hypothetical protein